MSPSENGSSPDSKLHQLESELMELWRHHFPQRASKRGLHQQDGQCPRLDEEGTEDLIEDLRSLRSRITSVDPRDGSDSSRQMRHVLLWGVDRHLYERARDPAPRVDPLYYLEWVDWQRYTIWDTRPLHHRIQALTHELKALPKRWETAERRLSERLHPVLVDKTRTLISHKQRYLEEELEPWVEERVDPSLAEEFSRAARTVLKALNRFDTALQDRDEAPDNDVRRGVDGLTRMLQMQERVDESLEDLQQAGKQERERLEREAKDLLEDSSWKSLPEAFQSIQADHPTADELIETSRQICRDLFESLDDQEDLPPLPDWNLTIQAIPPHQRMGYFARLRLPGILDDPDLAAFFELAPPDPDWSEDEKAQWMSFFNRPTLTMVAIHECFPGHLLHWHLVRSVQSRPRKLFESYQMLEGWAHFAEEIVLEHLPRISLELRLIQCRESLIRVVRYLASLRFHGGDLPLEEVQRMFEEQAHLDARPARQEAERVLHDPGYLHYTLGKFQLRALRAQHRGTNRSFLETLAREGFVPPELVETFWNHG